MIVAELRCVRSLRLFLITAAAVCMLAASAAQPQAADAPKVFRAGAVAVDITPQDFPVSSNGSMRDRQATGAHDPLHARCLVLDDGATRVAIVVCDSCMIPREIFDAAKRMAERDTGIAADRMLMSATHTHTAVTATGVFQSEPEEAYTRFLSERIAHAVKQAADNLEPARVGWAVGKDPSQVFNRRWFTKPGVNTDPFGRKTDRVRMNPGYANPDATEPSGPVDPDVSLLAVESLDGRPIAALANYSLHYVGGVPADMLSADYFGEFAAKFGQLLGANGGERPFVGIMSNGTSGNINNIDYSQPGGPSREPFEQISVVAASVANAALNAYREIEFREWAPLVIREAVVELGARLPSDEDLAEARRILEEAGPGPYGSTREIYARETVLLSEYPQTVRAKLQAIRVGNLGIASSPCETFVETGLAIKEHSPLEPTFIIELANGYNGYLPTPEQHELGGYETWRARSSYLAPNAEPIIRETLLKLLNEVARAETP